MQNTSSKYKELVKQSGRTFRAKILCTFEDGCTAELSDSDIIMGSLSITDTTSDEGSFSVGCAIINELDFEIDNSSGKYSNTSFDNAVFEVRIGLVIEQKYDGTTKTEWLRKGLYTAEEVTVDEGYIKVIAYDFMAKLDKKFSVLKLSYPTTPKKLLSAVCTYCGVSCGSLDFPNSDIEIRTNSYFDDSTTCRDVVSYIAQLACCYAYVDMSGFLQLGWYTETGMTINERQKLNGTVTITGVQITDVTDENIIYQLGTTNYCLIMDDNPLVQGKNPLENSVFTERLMGKELTPFESEIISDPSLEAGDIVTIYDLHGNAYKTPITNVIFKLDGKTTISCDAETANEKQRSSCSQSAKVLAAAKRETQKQLSEYEIRANLFNALTANSMGFYQTVVAQDDGSVICYQHDKPLLVDSKIIWKKSVDTFAVSVDGGKTWKGFDKDGNAVMRIIAVEGIIADWVRAGTLKGIEIIAEKGKIAGWTIKGNTLVSNDGAICIDSINNRITVNDTAGNPLMRISTSGITYIRGDKEIGSIGITKGAESETYGITFNLKDGDAMTWSVYDSTKKVYVNKVRYTQDNGFVVYGNMSCNNLSVSGDVSCNTLSIGERKVQPVNATLSDGSTMLYWGW